MLCEGGLRLFGIEYPLFYDYDPIIGYKLRPGVKGYFLDEGGAYVSINSDGWRDQEHAIQKPLNTLRIAVLGDSYAGAMQVNRQEAFWTIMAKELQTCDTIPDRNIEVMNFGISGLGTTQELLVLQHWVWKYSPDVVLLAFTTANDVSDNSKVLKNIHYLPYYVYQGNTLILENKQTREHWLAKQKSLWQKMHLDALLNFRTFQLIHHAKNIFEGFSWSLQDIGKKAGASMKGQEAGINDMIYREPTTEVWQEAWRVTEGVLLLMRDEVAQHGARFFIVTLTNGIQVEPDAAKRMAFAKSLGVNDLFYPERRLNSFCQSHHIPILLLGPPFQEYATQHHIFLHGFGKSLGIGHWNQNGHRLAGQTIAKWLCPQLK